MAENALKLLFVAESVTLAHVLRPLTLAVAMRKRGYEVHFASAEEHRGWAEREGLHFHLVTCDHPSRFLAALKRGAPVLDETLISAQVEEDLALLRSIRPDAVIGDFRLSLNISARIAGVPYLGITNAYWRTLTPRNMPLPETPVTRWVGPRFAASIFSFVPAAIPAKVLRDQARAINRVRTRHGLAPYRSITEAYTDSDHALFADVAELSSTLTAGDPMRHTLLGPLAGAPPCPLPLQWAELRPGVPTIYVSLGSSGDQSILPALISALNPLAQEMPLQWIVASPVRPDPGPVPMVWAPAIPGEQACERADLVICNGGAPSTFQALGAGKPLIAITFNFDQVLNMQNLARHPFARTFRSWGLRLDRVRDTAREFLTDPRPRREAEAIQRTLRIYDIPARLEEALRSVLGRKASPSPASGAGSIRVAR